MDAYVKESGTWKQANGLYVKDEGTWKTVSKGYVKQGGTWKQFFEDAISITISTSQEEVSLFSLAQAAGWDGSSVVTVNCTINGGVVIGTPVVSTSRPAFLVSGFPSGSEINLTNNGVIIGKFGAPNGGHGGHALKVRNLINLTNIGTIAGGGGAGGFGADDSGEYKDGLYNSNLNECVNNPVTRTCNGTGGNGGRGAGWHSTGSYYISGASGGSASNQTCTGLSDFGGGMECEGTSYTTTAEDGGDGGYHGANGSSTSADAGGSGGRAIDGHSYVTYVASGTLLGSLVN